MMRRGGEGMEEAYVHLAKTIAHARMVGLDSASLSSSSHSSSSSYPSTSTGTSTAAYPTHPASRPSAASASTSSTSQRQPQSGGNKKRRPAPAPGAVGIKTEDGTDGVNDGAGAGGGGGGGLFLPPSSSSYNAFGVNQHGGNGGNGNGGENGGREGGRWLAALRARTWWAVVVGDVLTADALGVPPHVAFGSLSSSPSSLSSLSSPSMQQVQDEDDPLARGRDWVEEGEGEGGDQAGGDGRQGGGGNGGKKFGGLVRLVRTLHAVHALPGLEGACRAEGAIRAWAEGELSSNSSSSTSNSSASNFNSTTNSNANLNNANGNGAGFEFAPEFGSAYVSVMEVDSPSSAYPHDSRLQHEKARQAREREDAEVALLAHRAVLGVWVGWVTYNPSSSSASASPPPQAVYGAVDAAHGIVQACRALAASSSSPANNNSSVFPVPGNSNAFGGNGMFPSTSAAHSITSSTTRARPSRSSHRTPRARSSTRASCVRGRRYDTRARCLRRAQGKDWWGRLRFCHHLLPQPSMRMRTMCSRRGRAAARRCACLRGLRERRAC
ncbi:hypothetical protein B0H13DRAFT_734358 [Mycena leptocephala]|nr:hypothetical protein B0H13DRAFT_734358 [Mycena leptocephala]